jgi:prepilin-type N-terminal cleavage/methylation domain-containing protein
MAGLSSRRKPGFTLIELLVVISIIGLLMGLTLPAVQKAREAGDRLRCANNLKQIGLALHHYELNEKHLPPTVSSFQGASWMVLIMPYLEQGPLYQRWDLSRTYYKQSDVARLTTVPIYFCPSRRMPNGSPAASISGDFPCTDPREDLHLPGALADYAASLGTPELAPTSS